MAGSSSEKIESTTMFDDFDPLSPTSSTVNSSEIIPAVMTSHSQQQQPESCDLVAGFESMSSYDVNDVSSSAVVASSELMTHDSDAVECKAADCQVETNSDEVC